MLQHPGTSRMAHEIGTGARGQRCPCRGRWYCWWKVRAVCVRDRLVTGKSTLPAQLREGGFLGDHPSTESSCGWEPPLPWGPLLSPGQPPPRTFVTSLPLLLTPAWPPRHPQASIPGGLAAQLPSADLISVSWSEQWCGLASVVPGRAAGGCICGWEARGQTGSWPVAGAPPLGRGWQAG